MKIELVPGQLVRLLLRWDDIDNDIEIQEMIRSLPCPDYYAEIYPTNNPEFNYRPISPGAVGMFLEYIGECHRFAIIQPWAIVLFGENKVKVPSNILEPCDGE